MKYLEVNKKDTEQIKKLLEKIKAFDKTRKIIQNKNKILIPILNISNGKIKKHIVKLFDYSILNLKAKIQKQGSRIDQNQSKNFKKYENIARGYDILGNIAIIKYINKSEKSKKLIGKAEQIAKWIINSNPSIKTVVAQTSPISGKFRLRKFKYISGIKTFIATYKENNCIFKFDIRKTFFSNRLSYERSRINKLIKPKEAIIVMFAGIGPFAIVIAKQHKLTNIICIELNKNAVHYLKENIKLNKIENIKAELGNVKKIYSKYKNFANRVIVPMPKSSIDYLDQILSVCQKTAIIHIYVFGDRDTVFAKTSKAIEEHARKNNYKAKILFKRIVRPYSAKEIEIVVDFKISKSTKK